MRTLVHLSDLHFGRVDEALLEPLIESVRAAKPDVVVVSGDLTQRARTGQFRDAAAFLARLPSPQIVVPGNHDVPLHNMLARFPDPRSPSSANTSSRTSIRASSTRKSRCSA